MTNLSELLNPVPSPFPGPGPGPGPGSTPGRPARIDTTSNPGDDQLSPPSFALLGSHFGRSSLDSPPEARPPAAIGTSSLYSPPRHAMTSLPPIGAGFQSLSPLRPPSSHGSPPLPPLSLSHQPEPLLGAFSSGLEKYHHASSDEVRTGRLPSLADGTSQTLAPLRSLSDENTESPMSQLEPAHNDAHRRNPDLAVNNSAQYSQDTQQVGRNQEEVNHRRGPTDTSQVQSETAGSEKGKEEIKHEVDEVNVKAEIIERISGISQDNVEDNAKPTPFNEVSPPVDETMREVTPDVEADREHDVKEQAMQVESDGQAPSVPAIIIKPLPSKKPTAAKSKVDKKGTASAVKGPAKRRKFEPDSATGTPSLPRSATPTSSRASKTPAPRNRKQSSVTPARSSSVVVANEAQDDEDAELFCICRKPDDHTWMIACDGPCEDWFHGKCVNMNEKDGNLIDKYICPNCNAKGVGQTTWKPMCRLESCRDPARVAGPKPSKYCSEVHGVEYMRKHATKQDTEMPAGGASGRKKRRRRDNYTDHIGNGEVEEIIEPEDAGSHLRGGFLRSSELKALADGVHTISEFRKLGDGVLSPPRTVSPDADRNNSNNNNDKATRFAIAYSPEETTQLTEIKAKEDVLQRRKTMLDHRDRFLLLVRARAKKALENLRKKETVKDICGFDGRLSWSDEEFTAWCASPDGIQSLESGNLCAPSAVSPPAAVPPLAAAANMVMEPDGDPSIPPLDDGQPPPQAHTHKNVDGGAGGRKAANGTTTAKDEEGEREREKEEEEIGRGVCQKRRCERHKTWWKLQQQDVAFERLEVTQTLRRLEAEERGVRKRALIRGLGDDGEFGGGDGDGDGDDGGLGGDEGDEEEAEGEGRGMMDENEERKAEDEMDVDVHVDDDVDMNDDDDDEYAGPNRKGPRKGGEARRKRRTTAVSYPLDS